LNDNIQLAKKIAAKSALDHIEEDMVIGFGSGSTVTILIEELKKIIKNKKLKIYGISSSIDTSLKLQYAGVELLDPLTVKQVDLAIDGADSVLTEKKVLIKGGGGAFVREKIVDYWAKELIIIVDETKINRAHPIPIEIIPTAIQYVKNVIEKKFGPNTLKLRDCKGKLGPCISDNGNAIADLNLKIEEIKPQLETELNKIPGIIDNGIFTKRALIKIGKITRETEEITI